MGQIYVPQYWPRWVKTYERGWDYFYFSALWVFAHQKHLNPVTWTPELSSGSVIVQPLCNLSFPLESTDAAAAPSCVDEENHC